MSRFVIQDIYQTALGYLLDRYGRNDRYNSYEPFWIYSPTTVRNYKPISCTSTITRDYERRKKLVEEGILPPNLFHDGLVLDHSLFEHSIFQVALVMSLRAKELSVSFQVPATEQLVKVVMKAQRISVDRFQKAVEIRRRALEQKEIEPPSSIDLFHISKGNFVWFLHAPCGTGKTTFGKQVRNDLSKYQLLKREVSKTGDSLIRKPLCNLQIVDSGEFLRGWSISREDISDTLVPNHQAFSDALRRLEPIIIVDVGDSYHDRVSMVQAVRDIRGPKCHIHTEYFKVPKLETIVRNQDPERGRIEYSLNWEEIYKTFRRMCALSDTYSVRDFSSPLYNKLFDELYNVTCRECVTTTFGTKKRCALFAHPLNLACEQFCGHCSLHCPKKHNSFVLKGDSRSFLDRIEESGWDYLKSDLALPAP